VTATRTVTATATALVGAPGDLYEIPTLSTTGTVVMLLILLGVAITFLARSRK
jgi:hypothetical protein